MAFGRFPFVAIDKTARKESENDIATEGRLSMGSLRRILLFLCAMDGDKADLVEGQLAKRCGFFSFLTGEASQHRTRQLLRRKRVFFELSIQYLDSS